MNNKAPIKPADILLPKNNFEKWSVVACDQFTSDRKYWADAEKAVGDAPSTLKITLPEIYLEDGDTEERISKINSEMKNYLENSVFNEYNDAIIYIERTQPDGKVRRGIIAAVDLEAYDYNRNSTSLIRATEGTVLERIPPRVKIRKDAPIELPHVMLLVDDKANTVIGPLNEQKNSYTKLYDFDLMLGGGHITGYLLDEASKQSVIKAAEALCGDEEHPLLFAVGDGNHSLATAKECYEQLKKTMSPEAAAKHPARYALAEIVNIHDDALEFEPIYRVIFGVKPKEVLEAIKTRFPQDTANTVIQYTYEGKQGNIRIDIPADKLSTGVIQDFIDDYIKSHSGAKVDYIHGINDVIELSKSENTIGFLYEGIGKDTLFSSVKATGALPRKTFSMGEARDKRYYLEARKIK